MDAFNRSDSTDQSQAADMLQELLANDKDASWKPTEAHESASKPHPNADSIHSSRNPSSLPHYHFHGLAATQTQSQPYEEDEAIHEGSQKENIGAAERNKDLSNPLPIFRPPSPHASSTRNAPGKATHVDSRIGFLSTNKEATKKTPAAVSFQSPRPKSGTGTDLAKQAARHLPYMPTFKRPSRYTPRPLSRTSSQDSFARDLSEDPEEQFLAKSKQFAIPLSELGRNPVSVDEGPDTSGTSNRAMFSYSSNRQQHSTSSPQGRVLVEATPSHSGGSQSQEDASGNLSEPMEATQLLDEPEFQAQPNRALDADGNTSGDDSSEPTSSFGRFLDGVRDPEPDVQPTQPSTQPQHSHMSNLASGPFHGWDATGTATTSYPQSAGPRSLVSLVRPENQWRYEKYQQPKQIMPSIHDYQSHSKGGHISSSGQETQPSHPIHSSAVPNQAYFTSSFSSNSHHSRNRSPPLRSPVGDIMDVVPDSEPICSDAPLTTNRPFKGSSATKHNNNVNNEACQDAVMGEIELDCAPHPKEEGDEIDEDDDIPLAAMSRKQSKGKAGPKAVDQRKGKAPQKIVYIAPSTKQNIKGRTGGYKELPEQSSTKAAQKLIVVPGPSKRTTHSWEVGEIPSSVPEQDIVNTVQETKKDVKPLPQSKHRSRSTSAAPKGQHQLSNSIDKEESDELLMAPADNNDGTELADDEYQDADPGPSSRKRKRAPSTKAPGANVKAAPKRSKRSNATPSTRARLRSAAPNTLTRAAGINATRVFALWKQDGHYYSGVVHSIEVGDKYMVKFDDGTSAPVNIDQMRRCQFHVGDDVLVANRTRGCKVVSVDKLADNIVTINLDDDIVDFEIRDIRVAHKTIAYTWRDRVLSPDAVVATVKSTKLKSSPSPSKLSITSVPPVRGDRKKVLTKTGLIVTLSATNGNWEKDKENIMNGVKHTGGFVIDDLSTVVRMEGQHSMNNNRWVIGKADAHWIGDDDIERLFLLADDPNQKPKFLIALALGIPCLSTAWLRDSVDSGEEKDWLGYLLPQGYSTILNARPSQQIDVDWGNSVHQLKHIMSNAVASKLFAEKSILCVGPEMVPQPKGRRRAGIDEKSQEAINAVARIILSMGADRVEAVTELRFADHNLSDYDYVVIREPSHYQSAFAECITVHWGWVKDCLIASRYLPLPDWPTESSQEA